MEPILRIVAVLVLTIASSAAWAEPSRPSISANDLARAAVANEHKHSADPIYFLFRQRTEKPKGTQVKQIIETPQGMIGRLLAINDQPLTPEQRRQDDERINRLLDPEKMREKHEEQQKDASRVRNMIASLGDAFNYEYDGTEAGSNGKVFTRLKMTPNPNFNPPSRETSLFQGMNGIMLVDPSTKRIAKIDGTLFRDVTFGWGLLGRLQAGGRFVVVQQEILPSHWEITDLTLDFVGKALMVKTVKIQQKQKYSDFNRVPDTLSVAQAINMLKKQENVVAQAERSGR
jgi:hypothetical protein